MDRELLLSLLIGYGFGSIPFGLLLTFAAGKGDIRKIGSGNIGATNVLRTGSKPLAAATLILDCLKAVAAILIARKLFGGDPLNDLAARYAAAGAFIGHLYPVWLKFKGGKGLATFLGILIPLLWPAAIVYAVVWIILVATFRISSVGGIAAAISAPLSALVFHSQLFSMLLGFALLALWKHRENIRRLTKGTEPRIGSKTSPTG